MMKRNTTVQEVAFAAARFSDMVRLRFTEADQRAAYAELKDCMDALYWPGRARFVCQDCGADRTREPCKRGGLSCPMAGTAFSRDANQASGGRS